MQFKLPITTDGRVSTKQQQLKSNKQRISSTNVAKDTSIPESYISNSLKEELCLEYSETFIQQFTRAFPLRKPPFLVAENEFGVKKLLCSTIRPTRIPFTEMNDVYECALFFAGYCQYEPLNPPNQVPIAVFSPTHLLEHHAGDCFDLSILLTSYLIGVGYNACVAYGYSPETVTLKDQHLSPCPINSNQANDDRSYFSKAMNLNSSDKNNLQNILDRKDSLSLNSEFEKVSLEKQLESQKDNFQLWIPAVQSRDGNDDSQKLCLHCWVIILPTSRDIKEVLFVETSTGKVYNKSNCPYLQLEMMFNHDNYWINLDLSQSMNEINFDVKNASSWETVFVSSDISKHEQDVDVIDEKSTSIPIKFSISQRNLEAPKSWVDYLQFDRTKYLLRYPPSGFTTLQYYCCKVDYYARGINSQSMVMRVTKYLDEDCIIVSDIFEWYENRKDKLYKRVRSYLHTYQWTEYYHPGSVGEVQTWNELPGKSIHVTFYVVGRLDGLYERIENIGSSVTEKFQNRTDLLVERTVNYVTDFSIHDKDIRKFILSGGTLTSELFVVSMSQIYFEDVVKKEANQESIYSRQYDIIQGKLVETYYMLENSIRSNIKTYYHSRLGLGLGGTNGNNTTGKTLASTINLITFSQDLGVDDSMEGLQRASSLERECFFTQIKASIQDFLFINEAREKYEAIITAEKPSNVFELSVYDLAVNYSFDDNYGKMNNENDFSDRNKSYESDYLTPFLLNIKDISKITYEEAMMVRNNCLDAYKARLVERANIIQNRLRDETSKLARKQEQFQRSQRDGDFSTEEYEKYCTDTMFRIQILEQRLAEHEEKSLRKLPEFSSKLDNDPRLVIIKQRSRP